MFKLLKIYNVGFEKIRVGPNRDGGYILLNEHSKKVNNLLSFGVEDNIDFEIDFNKRYKPKLTKLYDHTVKKLPKKNNFIFKKKGLGINISKNFETLESITKNFDDNNILKMDIEYDEWEVFENANTNTLKKFKQIIVEFHLFFLDENDVDANNKLTPYFKQFSKDNYNKINKFLLKKYENVFKKLIMNFTIFHISANNSLPIKKIFKTKFPQLLELSLVRNDLVKKKKLFKGSLPIKYLDYPNKYYKDDLKNFYPF